MAVDYEQRLGVYGGENYDMWRTPQLTLEQFETLSTKEKLKYYVKLATLAANTHNAQPWAFSINDHEATISIHLDRIRVLPASDPDGRQSVISCGAAMENICVVAAHFGSGIKTDIMQVERDRIKPYKADENGERYIKLGDIGFVSRPSIDHTDLFQAIFTRRMDRSMTDTSREIPPEIINEILSYGNSYAHIAILTAGDRRITGIALAQGAADAFVANKKNFAEELGIWLKENNTQEFEGMPGSTFGMSQELTSHIKRGLQGKERLSMDDIASFYASSEMGVNSAAAVVVIAVDQDIPTHWIEAGKILERVALRCETEKDLNIAVHAGLAEVDVSNFGLKVATGVKGHPVIYARIGYRLPYFPSTPHSPRRLLEDVLIS